MKDIEVKIKITKKEQIALAVFSVLVVVTAAVVAQTYADLPAGTHVRAIVYGYSPRDTITGLVPVNFEFHDISSTAFVSDQVSVDINASGTLAQMKSQVVTGLTDLATERLLVLNTSDVILPSYIKGN